MPPNFKVYKSRYNIWSDWDGLNQCSGYANVTDDRHNINNDTERVVFEPLLNVYKMHLRVSETAVLFYVVLEVVYGKEGMPIYFYLQNLKPSNFLREKLKPSRKFLKYLHLQSEREKRNSHTLTLCFMYTNVVIKLCNTIKFISI